MSELNELPSGRYAHVGRKPRKLEVVFGCAEDTLAELSTIELLTADLVAVNHDGLKNLRQLERGGSVASYAAKVERDLIHEAADHKLIFQAIASGLQAQRELLRAEGYTHLVPLMHLAMEGALVDMLAERKEGQQEAAG